MVPRLKSIILVAFTCAALTTSTSDKIIWINAAGVLQSVDTSGEDVTEIITLTANSNGIAVDEERCLVYWSDNSDRMIRHTNIAGLSATFVDVLDTQNDVPTAIFRDSASNTMYWTTSLSRVKRADLDADDVTASTEEMTSSESGFSVGRMAISVDTSVEPRVVYLADNDYELRLVRQTWGTTSHEVVLDAYELDVGALDAPSSVVIDGVNRFLYWTDSFQRKVIRVPVDNLDSDPANRQNDFEVLVDTQSSGFTMANPKGLVVDAPNNKMYWADQLENKVYAADLSGNYLWEVDTGASPRAMAFVNGAAAERCFTSTTTTSQSSTTSTTSQTLTTSTATFTSSTVTSTTTTSKTSTTTTTSSTTETLTTTTGTRTTTTTSTTTITTSTTGTTTFSTSTSSSTTVSTTTSSSTTTQSTTTTTTTTVTMSTLTTTSSTLTTTTTSTTTDTTTTTLHEITKIEGDITIVAKDPVAFEAALTLHRRDFYKAIQYGIADVVSEVEWTMVTYPDFSALNFDKASNTGTFSYKIEVADDGYVMGGTSLTPATFDAQDAAFFTSFNSALSARVTQVDATVSRLEMATPTFTEILSISTTTSTASSTTTTTSTTTVSSTTTTTSTSSTTSTTTTSTTSSTTTTTTTSVSSTTSSSTSASSTTTTQTDTKPVALLQGSLSLSARGANETQIENAVIDGLADMLNIDKTQDLIEVTRISQRSTRRLSQDFLLSSGGFSFARMAEVVTQPRRLAAFIWDVDYRLGIPATKAVTIVTMINDLSTNEEPLLNSLKKSLVEQGQNPAELLLAVRSITNAALLAVTGPPVDSCGDDREYCTAGYIKKPSADDTVCKYALNCSQATEACCDAKNVPKLAGPLTAMASAPYVTIFLAFVITMAVVTCLCCFQFLSNPVLFRSLPRCIRSKFDCLLSKHDDSQKLQESLENNSFSPGPRLALQSAEMELQVLELLLNDLQGEWRLFDQDQMMAGIVRICENGRTLYDGVHYQNQDLCPQCPRPGQPAGIIRGDGWCIDMQRSDTDSLEWMKSGESGISWKRCKGISAFSIGDRVEWTAASTEQVEQGAHGIVVGFTDDRVRVNFEGTSPNSNSSFRSPRKPATDCKPSALAVIESARSDEEEYAEPPRALPSLAHCAEFKRLSLFADTIGKENTGLADENERLRRDISNKVDKLTRDNTDVSRENTRLRQELDYQRELTNSVVASKEYGGLAAENKILSSNVEKAEALQKELSEHSMAAARLRVQVQACGGRGADLYSSGPASPSSFSMNGPGLIGMDRPGISSANSNSSFAPPVGSRQRAVPQSASPSSARWQSSAHARNGNFEQFYAADDDDDDDESDDENVAI